MTMMKKCRMLAAGVLALLLGGCSVSAAAVTEPQTLTAVRYLDAGEWADGAFVRQMTSTALYTLEDGELTPGLAGLPVDVTGEYAGTRGVPTGAERCYAFRVPLAEDVFWEDGTAVTAGDLLTAIQAKLDTDFRWLSNAEGYLAGWERDSDTVVSLADAGFGTLAEAEAAGYTRFYVDTAELWGLDGGWEPITDRARIRDWAMPSGLEELYVTPAYLYRNYLAEGKSLSYLQGEFLGVTADRADVLTLEDVGAVKTGGHELLLISASPVTAGTVAARLLDLTLTDSRSYGPYRVVSADAEEILLERNPYWAGDTEEYQRIRCLAR
ncbi:MAG: hypothetical protein IJ375_03645 [Oscillospiraceae bacterium]|nr:hypothetical protein [Oscillospiraceae bacterium]